jgi:hypothetical protein
VRNRTRHNNGCEGRDVAMMPIAAGPMTAMPRADFGFLAGHVYTVDENRQSPGIISWIVIQWPSRTTFTGMQDAGCSDEVRRAK